MTYTKYTSFRSHVYKKHREVLTALVPAQQLEDDEEGDGETNWDPDADLESGDDEPATGASEERSIKRAAALFILKCMEERKISQVSSPFN